MDTAAQDVLEYWFGPQQDGFPVEDRDAMWWTGGSEVDERIRSRFGQLLQQASSGDLDHWRDAPESCLALVIVLDQFSRNVFRGAAEAFAADAKAQELVRAGLAQQFDRSMGWSERSFFYMPLEHSEDLEDQDLCVRLFEAMQREAPNSVKARLQAGVDFALMHRDIIVRFGRFPHRNRVLGRESTREEEQYLDGGGQTFGQ